MAMAKILLCALNSQYIHSNPGVWSLKMAAEQYARQYNLTIPPIEIQAYTINDAHDRVLGSILRKKPDILGFSVYIWNVTRVVALLRDLRRVLPECRIVLGGPEVSFGCAHISDDLYDAVIPGEGERRFFASLLQWLNIPLPPDFDPNRPLSGGEIPFIYTDDNMPCFDHRIVYYESSRGCPFSCAYCLSGKQDSVRFKPLEQVYQDLDFFIRHRVPQVKFVDRTFNCHPARSKAILAYLIDRGAPGMNFHFECAGDLFDEDQLQLIAQAPKGLFQFEIGIQSTSGTALQAACRKTDTQAVLGNVRRLLQGGNCHVHVDLIAGLPGEDYSRFTQSFNDVYALHAHQLQLGFLKILKGAPLNDQTDRHGYVFSSNPPYEILENRYLSNPELLRMKGVEDVLNRYYNSGRYPKTLAYLIQQSVSPWTFYEQLGDWFIRKDLLGQGLSSRNTSEMLLAYAKDYFPGCDEAVAWCLLEDFYRSDPSDVVPISLKPYHTSPAVSRKMLPVYPSGQTVRVLRGQVYLADYGKRDSITGQFSLTNVTKTNTI